MSVYVHGDRVQHIGNPGTGAFLTESSGLIHIRWRNGMETQVPADQVARAPWIQYGQGLYAYEYPHNTPVLFLQPHATEFTKGTIDRYLTAKELYTREHHHDQLFVLAKGLRHMVGVDELKLDLGEWSRRRWAQKEPESDRKFPPFEILDPFYEDIRTQLDWANIDWNGHLRDGRDWTEINEYWWNDLPTRTEQLSQLRSGDAECTPTVEEITQLRAVWATGEVLPNWIPLGIPDSRNVWTRCEYCGRTEYETLLETNGKAVRLSGPRCPNPQGDVTVTVRLSLPTGRLLFGGDVRKDVLPVHSMPDINTLLGLRRWGQMFADAGAVHAYVGDTTPVITQLKSGAYRVARYPRSGPGESKKLAKITTWERVAVLMSADLAEQRLDYLDYETSDLVDIVGAQGMLTLEPGTYEFTYDPVARRLGSKRTQNFISFKRVGDATPIDDTYFLHWYEREYVAQEQIAQVCKRWNYQGSLENLTAWAAMDLLSRYPAEEWHPLGFCTSFPMSDIDNGDLDPMVEIPVLRELHGWNFWKGSGALMAAAGIKGRGEHVDKPSDGLYLSPSYQELAYRVLQNMVRYGTATRKGTENDAQTDDRARDQIRLASMMFHLLNNRWPDTFGGIDPEFTAWMQSDTTVKSWIDQLQLSHYDTIEPEPPYPHGHQSQNPRLMAAEAQRRAAQAEQIRRSREPNVD